MRANSYFIVIMLVLWMPSVALAFPDVAPWGSADPDNTESCASCHFDGEPIVDSLNVSLVGIVQGVSPGKEYRLAFRLADVNSVVAGFMAQASAGEFSSNRAKNLEAKDNMIRSTEPVRPFGRIVWNVRWTAPEDLTGLDEVAFDLAINASNHDGSPFGDQIYYRRFVIPVKDNQ